MENGIYDDNNNIDYYYLFYYYTDSLEFSSLFRFAQDEIHKLKTNRCHLYLNISHT